MQFGSRAHLRTGIKLADAVNTCLMLWGCCVVRTASYVKPPVAWSSMLLLPRPAHGAGNLPLQKPSTPADVRHDFRCCEQLSLLWGCCASSLRPVPVSYACLHDELLSACR